jgi:hypothetical protein
MVNLAILSKPLLEARNSLISHQFICMTENMIFCEIHFYAFGSQSKSEGIPKFTVAKYLMVTFMSAR